MLVDRHILFYLASIASFMNNFALCVFLICNRKKDRIKHIQRKSVYVLSICMGAYYLILAGIFLYSHKSDTSVLSITCYIVNTLLYIIYCGLIIDLKKRLS